MMIIVLFFPFGPLASFLDDAAAAKTIPLLGDKVIYFMNL